MKTIAFNSEKGGTGKTTLAAHLAGGLAAQGRNVLLIDTDPQANATLHFGLRPEPGFQRVIVEEADPIEWLREPNPITYADNETPRGHLVLIPGSIASYNVTPAVEDDFILMDALAELNGIDIIVIDTPPTPGMMMSMVYRAADMLTLPTQLELFSLEGLRRIIRRVHRPEVDLALLSIIPNMYRAKTTLHAYNFELLTEASQKQGWPLATPLPQRTDIGLAAQNQRLVWALDPTCRAAHEMWTLVDELAKGIDTWQTAKS